MPPSPVPAVVVPGSSLEALGARAVARRREERPEVEADPEAVPASGPVRTGCGKRDQTVVAGPAARTERRLAAEVGPDVPVAVGSWWPSMPFAQSSVAHLLHRFDNGRSAGKGTHRSILVLLGALPVTADVRSLE
ncbi:hypothetical protein GCM10009872_35120 [Actinopolymorpha rutila]